MVIFNNTVTTIGNVYYEKIKTQPDVTLAYYTINETPGDIRKFTVERKHNVVFVPESLGAPNDPESQDPEGETGAPEAPSICQAVIASVVKDPTVWIPFLPYCFVV